MKLATAVLFVVSAGLAQVPRTWEQAAVDTLELPRTDHQFSPVHITETDYYRIPERVIYRSYPVYAPGHEPESYERFLKSADPAVAFDATVLKTDADWAAAGELVFNAPTSFQPMFFTAKDLRDPAFFRTTGMPIAKDGTIPFARWVVRRKGVPELGVMGCNTCHTRVLQDGTIVPGAQGNNPNDRQGARLLRSSAAVLGEEKVLARVLGFARQFEMPWLANDPNRIAASMTPDQFIAAGEAIPPGVTVRANTSMILPPQIPDLIGVRERRFLDHTGLVHNRGIGDLMRYASLAQDMFSADRYNSPEMRQPSLPAARYSDAQLYALARYLYSLEPPPNPNPFNTSAARGKVLFTRERCNTCHTPPLYTNNRLVAVEGVAERTGSVTIGVDPRYTLQTRKGTGFYKVPSLKGVWYRGPFGHNGPAAKLQDWFDPRRLDPDYVPTGFAGYDGKTRSIPGHPFGMGLSPAERQDLISFLDTL